MTTFALDSHDIFMHALQFEFTFFSGILYSKKEFFYIIDDEIIYVNTPNFHAQFQKVNI